jgi:hypothetical protein
MIGQTISHYRFSFGVVKSMVFGSGGGWNSKEIWVSGLSGETPRKPVPVEEGQNFLSPVYTPQPLSESTVRRRAASPTSDVASPSAFPW